MAANHQPDEFHFPIEIIHHIQSFLSPDAAARTSAISKQWYSAWSTRPILVFNNENRRYWKDYARISSEDEEQNVRGNYAWKALQRYRKLNLKVDKLEVGGFINMDELFDDVVTMFPSLKEIRAEIKYDDFNYSYLPNGVYQLTSLRKLSLANCIAALLEDEKVRCSSLVSLRLHYVQIGNESIQDILSACPLIEDIDLFSDTAHYYSRVNVSKMRNLVNLSVGVRRRRKFSETEVSVEFEDSSSSRRNVTAKAAANDEGDREEIDEAEEIGAENHDNSRIVRDKVAEKETFPVVAHDGSKIMNVVTEFCKLRSLTLELVRIDDEDFFTAFSTRFPCIQDLRLGKLGHEEMHISSPSLKNLSLSKLEKLKAGYFDVPNILKFKFEAKTGFTPMLSIITSESRAWESTVDLTCKRKGQRLTASWFVEMRKFLQQLRHSRVLLKIMFRDCTTPSVKEIPRLSTPVVIENLTVKLYFPQCANPRLVSSLMERSLSRSAPDSDEDHPLEKPDSEEHVAGPPPS